MSLDHGQELAAMKAASRGLPQAEVARATGLRLADVREAWDRLSERRVRHPVIVSGWRPEYPEGAQSIWVWPVIRVTTRAIMRIVAEYYGLTVNDFTSQRRDRRIVYPRQMAMLLCQEVLASSLPDIGYRFGNRDHSTVIHGIREATERVRNRPEIAAELIEIREIIAAKYPAQAGEGI